MDHMITVGLLAAVAIAAGFLAWTSNKQARTLRARFSGVVDIDGEQSRVQKSLDDLRREKERFDAEDQQRRSKLNTEYEHGLNTYNHLKQEVALLEENLEDLSFGLYKPHFNFQTPEGYKNALERLREEERQVIRDGRAATCPKTWTVGNSLKEGARMVRLNSKLVLRAFNGECEAALADVSWNNITRMEERIRKSAEAITKLGDVLEISITPEYLKLKLDELRLAHELEQKKYQDREDQRRIREERREEERALREIEQAREEAEREELRFQKALEKAREEAARSTGAQLEKLCNQISSFEAKLDEARQKKERAISRAQITKSGFVYVISNIGSFGDRVYKIGMTRRLEPMERVYELGGASVPFPFDLHAMVYSDNAPDLEYALHRHFEEGRINMVNPRREFYRDLGLDEVEAFVRSRGLTAQFIKDVEAREYRETIAKRENEKLKQSQAETEQFSTALFQAVGTS
jgi:hypothetical protein